MKRLVLAVALVAAVASGALAQDAIYTNFLFGSKAYPLPVSSTPCFSQHPVQMQVYDSSAWFVWTCSDGRVIPVRFFHPNDKAEITRVVPVRIVEDMPPAYNAPIPTATTIKTCTGGAPAVGWVCVQGGWLPPDHPLAK
jgi:hypothetical protein